MSVEFLYLVMLNNDVMVFSSWLLTVIGLVMERMDDESGKNRLKGSKEAFLYRYFFGFMERMDGSCGTNRVTDVS